MTAGAGFRVLQDDPCTCPPGTDGCPRENECMDAYQRWTEHNATFGEGAWVVHDGCPDAAIAGQGRAVHHKEYHRV